MKAFILYIVCILCCTESSAQVSPHLNHEFEGRTKLGVYVFPIHSDENCSTFLIEIERDVPPHKHEWHTEQVYILQGKAEMTLNDETFMVKKGDWIIIPEGSLHSVDVRSKKSLRVISVQSPEFKGDDRVWL